MDKLQSFLLIAPILLLSVVAHEYAHGYAAFRQGDMTAYQLGRLTFNPIKHIDPFMTIVMPIVLYFTVGFALGGAKPVPVNPRNYRNFKRGDIIVSLAGVATNLVIGILCALTIPIFGLIGRGVPPARPSIGILQAMALLGIYVNFTLVLFNLLPIPPLDGSHVMKYLLPPAWSLKYQQFGRFGLLILVALMWLPINLLGIWLIPAQAGAGLLLRLVEPMILPDAMHWLR